MQEELSKLKNENSALQSNINNIVSSNDVLQRQVRSLEEDNDALKKQFEDLNQMVVKLQSVEEELRTSVQTLNDKLKDDSDNNLDKIMAQVEQLRQDTQGEIDKILSKMKDLETNLKQSPKFGIFSYLEEKEQSLFIRTVDQAVLKEKTFAKINEYLSEKLPPELDKKLKAHPSLTKTYIKNFKKD